MKIRTEVNDTETKNTVQNTNESKNLFSDRNKIDESLARHTKKQTVRTQENKIRCERGDITTDMTETERILRKHYAQQ